MPMRANCAGMMPRFSNDTLRIVSSDWFMAAMPMKLPTSIMSGSSVCSVPPSDSTPSMVSRFEAMPEMRAPMRMSILHNCCR